jgi:hypothetical protein
MVGPLTFGFLLLTEAEATATRLLGGLLVVGCYVCYVRFVPLAPTTPESVRFMRWWYVIGWTILALAIAMGILYLKRNAA